MAFRRAVGALVLIGLGTVEAAPPRRTTPAPAARRPATTSAKPGQQTKPAPANSATTNSATAKPTAPLTVRPGAIPTPPQPKREEDAAPAATTKPAIPHPAVSAEVKTPTVAPLKPAPAQPPAVAAPAAVPSKAAPSAPAAAAVVVRPDADGKYALRYHFSAGETVRWQVEHRAKIVTSVQGATQTAETVTISTKAWRVAETLPGGETRFVNTVEAIEMRQKLTGRQEVVYNSRTDKDVPPLFADAAKQIGIPLSEVTIDSRGAVLKRQDRAPRPEGSPTNTITLVLPDRPLAIGESWQSPFDLSATDAEGRPKTVKARHKLTLEKVDGPLALLRHETQILSPLDDPTIEAQVVQAEQTGYVTFDLARGRIVEQRSHLDKEVFGFQGPESKLHYVVEFNETLGDGGVAASTAEPRTAEADGAANPLR